MSSIFYFLVTTKERLIRSGSFALLLYGVIHFASCQANGVELVQSGLVKPEKEIRVSLVSADSLELIATKNMVLYEGKPFSDTAVSYYENGKQAITIDYNNGIRNGYYRKWFDSGLLSFESRYIAGKRNGKTASWWRNGNKRSESNFVNGIAEGSQKEWYMSGAIFKQVNLVAGKENGLQQSWRENGKIYNNYEAKDGRIFGLKRASLCFSLKDEELQI